MKTEIAHANFATWAIQAPPKAPFVTTEDGRSFTYGEMQTATARYATALAELGVQPGDRIAVQVEKSVEALFLYIACLRAGAVYLPLNGAYTHGELDYFIGDATPALVVCRPQDRAAVTAIAHKHGATFTETMDADGTGSLLDIVKQQEGSRFIDYGCKGDDLATIIYTSGTTGRSKGAMITHQNLRSNAEALADIWEFTDRDVLLHALPLFHIHGLFVATNVVMAKGASMRLLAGFHADRIMAAMSEVTVMMGVPTFYTRLLQHPKLNKASVAHMRLFVSGSAPLLAETHRQWSELTGHDILERYGMTETGIIASNPYDQARVPGSVGFPLPDTDVRIADADGRDVPQGEIGMIEVRGPGIFRGYWQMPEKTQSEFRADGFFITGDLGRRDEAGYLHIVGRNKDLVISGGYNVYPREIEMEIDLLPGVEESAVIGVPHPDFGEGVTAIVVGKTDEGAVLAGLSGKLAKFKLPKRVIVVDALPRNTMGKVQKNALRETFGGLYRE